MLAGALLDLRELTEINANRQLPGGQLPGPKSCLHLPISCTFCAFVTSLLLKGGVIQVQ